MDGFELEGQDGEQLPQCVPHGATEEAQAKDRADCSDRGSGEQPRARKGGGCRRGRRARHGTGRGPFREAGGRWGRSGSHKGIGLCRGKHVRPLLEVRDLQRLSGNPGLPGRMPHGGGLRATGGEKAFAPVGNGSRAVPRRKAQRPVDGIEEIGPVAGLRDLRRRRHVVFAEAQRGFLGRMSGHGAIERAAERVDVGPGPQQAAVGGVLLVRGVAGLDDAGGRAAHLRHRPARGAEIEQHRGAVGANEDVVGGDVAMQEIGRVDQLQRIEQRRREPIQLSCVGGRPRALSQASRLSPCSKRITM